MKKILYGILTYFLIVLYACVEMPFDPDKDLDTSHVFFDDFSEGIRSQYWEIGNDKWGIGNGGVIYQNVSYTADGVVVLSSNGDYYEGDLKGIGNNNGKRTGAMIKTRDSFGPGRYEVRMMPLPRFGATTAIWTYYNDGKINHEIDIELNVMNDFKVMCTTNWITESEFATKNNDIDTVLNDGQYHTFRFDWHTNPARVDYYLDNVLISTQESYVPNHAGEFNIGNWFPNGWAGNPDFETDHMFVDWFKYTPYLNNEYIDTPDGNASNATFYPSEPSPYPTANLISNGTIENTSNAWLLTENTNVTIDEVGIDNGRALVVPENEITYQLITGMDESFLMYFETYVKLLDNSSATLIIEFYPHETIKLGQELVSFNSSDAGYQKNKFYKKSHTFNMPNGTKRLEISLMTNSGVAIFDNVYLNKDNLSKPSEVELSNYTFFDDFNTINKDDWIIGNRKWGLNNGGVIYQNVSLSTDGNVILAANGDYYAGNLVGIGNNHGRRTGSMITTTEAFGPGSFEVRARALPRFGGTSAFWTFFYGDGGNINHEIDIELNVNNDFSYSWFTNWLSETNYTTNRIQANLYHNDRNYHLYRFDWHTSDTPRIEYYIDDVLYHTEYEKVPYIAGAFNIGVWFPNGWAGNPDFETDYMLVDYFGYTAFDEPFTKTPKEASSPSAFYPTTTTSLPSTNTISNGSFSHNLGWSLTDAEIKEGLCYLNDGIASQRILGVYEEYCFSISYISSDVSFRVAFVDKNYNVLSSALFSSGSTVVAPSGSNEMLISAMGLGWIDDIVMEFIL